MTLMDLVEEDDGPVVLARRKSRHGDYYEEIPPEPEPTPVPVQPEPVPEPPVWGEQQTALDYITGLATADWNMATAAYVPPVTITSNTGNWTSGYSISLNDVIGSYKGGMLGGSLNTGSGETVTIEGVYDPSYQAAQAALKAATTTKECAHLNNSVSNVGAAVTLVRCLDCKRSWCEYD